MVGLLASLTGWSLYSATVATLAEYAAVPTPPAETPPLVESPFDRFDPASLPQDRGTFAPVELIGVLEHGRSDPPLCLAISPDGEWLAAGLGSTVQVWRTGTVQLAGGLGEHPGPVRALAFDAAGKVLVAGGGYPQDGGPGGWLQVWKLEDKEIVAGGSKYDIVGVRALAFTPTGELIVAGDPIEIVLGNEVQERSHRLTRWRVITGSLKKEADLDEGVTPLHSMAISPDGQTLAVATSEQEVLLWNLLPVPVFPELRWATTFLLAVLLAGVLFRGRLSDTRRLRWTLRIGGRSRYSDYSFAARCGC